MTERGLEVRELPPAAFLRWADLWLCMRDAPRPVRELWIRYYGRAADRDSWVSVLPNADVLDEQPEPGALLTIRFDLNEIFSRAEQALADISSGDRQTWEEMFGVE